MHLYLRAARSPAAAWRASHGRTRAPSWSGPRTPTGRAPPEQRRARPAARCRTAAPASALVLPSERGGADQAAVGMDRAAQADVRLAVARGPAFDGDLLAGPDAGPGPAAPLQHD